MPELKLPSGLTVDPPTALLDGVDVVIWHPRCDWVGGVRTEPALVTEYWVLCGASLRASSAGAQLAGRRTGRTALGRLGRPDPGEAWELRGGSVHRLPAGTAHQFLSPGGHVELDGTRPAAVELGETGAAVLTPGEAPAFRLAAPNRRLGLTDAGGFPGNPLDVEVRVGLRYLLGFLTLGARLWAQPVPETPLLLSGPDGSTVCGLLMPCRMGDD